MVEDQLYPQLQKSLSGIADALSRRGFDVLRADLFADETAVLFFELSVSERPAIERHDGPPVHVRAHAAGFYEKYADDDSYGPFIENDRYVVERRREFTTATRFLESETVFDSALGVHVEQAMREGYEVLSGDEIGVLAAEFGRELARYFDPKP
ncbi:hypothetical protein ACFFQF_06690 [Haladaptatus pallidirubidus]|uniref:hypothetical protein n=1 Tax=Haladaptatus pallidirubidus TaxID=1008152 RepID=UPI0035E77917